MKNIRSILLLLLLVVAYLAAPSHAPTPLPVATQAGASGSLADMSQHINSMAQHGAQITLSKHARERMEQRHVSLEDIREVLSHGSIRHAPRKGDQGDMIYKLEQEDTRGSKDGEVVVIPREDSLFIVTVMWDGHDD